MSRDASQRLGTHKANLIQPLRHEFLFGRVLTDIGRGDLTVPVWESVDGHWTRGLNSSCFGE